MIFIPMMNILLPVGYFSMYYSGKQDKSQPFVSD